MVMGFYDLVDKLIHRRDTTVGSICASSQVYFVGYKSRIS
ncbi:Hypothetical protein Cul131001_1466 [Corynebacterium ulcerans]|nr:Hypothetical protein Cul05146_1411 [Corynebacterium ulcerans]ALD95162.1 Hypothetical protein Cul131001_1466 [Corynebacterium ulcerans]